MALGLFLAVIVNNALRFRAFFRAAYYFPALASSAAITAIAIYLLSADGLVNQILGTDQPWLGDSDTALESIMALNIWTTSGTIMLFYLAALQSISTDVYEAAAIDGAKNWRTFWKITFPLLQARRTSSCSCCRSIGCLKVFDQAYIVSGGSGGPNYSTLTPVLYLYQTAIQDVDFGYAAALGVALFLVIFTAHAAPAAAVRQAGSRPDDRDRASRRSSPRSQLAAGGAADGRRARIRVAGRLHACSSAWRCSSSCRSSGACRRR